MINLIRLAFAAAFFGLCLAAPVPADEPETLLANPGYRPDSDRSAAFIAAVPSAKFTVFPTVIRTAEETSYSTATQQWVVGFLELNGLGTGTAVATRFDMGQLKRVSQWEMFQSSMAAIGGQLGKRAIEGDYAIVVEIVIPPATSRSIEVFGIHCFVLEPDGTNAFSFLLNSHHQAFNDASLRTRDLSTSGKEWLAEESTRLALLALKAQIDQEPESAVHTASPGAAGLRTSTIDSFESGLPEGADSVGVSIGFHTFSDATSKVSIAVTNAHPPLPGEISGNHVLQLDMDLSGWAGFIHSFENEAVTSWTPRNWRAFVGFRFWLYGNDTGTSLFVDVLDNRKRYSTSDDAERYTFEFKDDFAGWKQLTVPFAKMRRKDIRNGAPDDGLNLSEVHGWAFGNSSSAGEVTYYIDGLELYGGRVNLPDDQAMTPASESRWRNLEVQEGRFRVEVKVRMDPPAGMEGQDFPKVAVFTWPYPARMNGMPKDTEELLQVLAWARRLDDLLVAGRSGFQFGTRGGANRLRSYYYVADVEDLKALSLQAGEQRLKTGMELEVSQDPNWEQWIKMGGPPRGAARQEPGSAEETAIPVSAMDPTLRFQGFSVRRPNDHRWRLIRNYRTPHIATFSFAPLSATHSFNATVLLRGLPKAFHTQEDFKAFIDLKVQDAGLRFEQRSYASTMTELHGQWAVRYEALFLDKAPANSRDPLYMSIKGVMYLHPLRDRIVVDAFYSERGTRSDLDGSLDPVGEELIEGTIPER